MIKLFKRILVVLALLISLSIFSMSVYASPAFKAAQQLSQPSGLKFNAALTGDERFSYTLTDTDDLVIKGSDNYWYYTLSSSGVIKKSDAKYRINSKPKGALTKKDVPALKKAASANKKGMFPVGILPTRAAGSSGQSAVSSAQSSGSTALSFKQPSGPQKLLILLVEFTDTKIQYSDSTWNNLFFGDTGSTVKNYYSEASGGRFYFTPAAESYCSSTDGVVKVSLNYAHPNAGMYTDSRNQKIVHDALAAADQYVDFSSFDTNNDGYISFDELHIVTVVAGYESSYDGTSPGVWGHRWVLDGSSAITLDGKSLCNPLYGGYIQMGENHRTHMATIGIACHELGHDLGLPDLYDTTNSSEGVGVYSLMGSGSWSYTLGQYPGGSPSQLDPWCKAALGFVVPTTVSTGTPTVYSSASGQYNVIKVPTSDPNQYFLVENRELSGSDAGLKNDCLSGGIAIWHIDEGVISRNIASDSVNDDYTHKGVDLEEANEGKIGHSQLDYGDSSVLNNFYYLGNNTTFGAGTTPSSRFYSGEQTNVRINVEGGSSDSMTIQVVNAPDTAKLSSLTVGTGAISPSFTPDNYSYSLAVDNSVSSIDITAIPSNTDMSMKIVGYKSISSGGTNTVSLNVGANKICVFASMENEPIKIYTIYVTRAPVSESAGKLEFSSDTYYAYEGKKNAAFAVSRSEGYSGAVSVDWTITGGTAIQGTDYTGATSGTANFDGFQQNAVIHIPIVQDNITETGRTIELTLSNPKGGAAIGLQSTAVINLLDFIVDTKTLKNTVKALTANNSTIEIRPGVSEKGLLSVTLNNSASFDVCPEDAVWKTTSAAIATVDSTGLITGISPGKTIVTATYRGKTAKFTVDTRINDLIGIAADGTWIVTSNIGKNASVSNMHLNDTNTITLFADNIDTNSTDVSSIAKWSSSDKKIATVDNKGVVTTTNVPGSALITGSYGGKMVQLKVNTVLEDLSPSEYYVYIKTGKSETITLSAVYADDISEDVRSSAVWKSSNTRVAAASNGVITAVSSGSATITATYKGKSVKMYVYTFDN